MEGKKKVKVTDTFTVTLTQVYEVESDPSKEDLMSEQDYETLFTHLCEISDGLIDSFDDAKVSKLKHFVSEESD
jgi:hypothetical protein